MASEQVLASEQQPLVSVLVLASEQQPLVPVLLYEQEQQPLVLGSVLVSRRAGDSVLRCCEST